jgi:hypothetical protein
MKKDLKMEDESWYRTRTLLLEIAEREWKSFSARGKPFALGFLEFASFSTEIARKPQKSRSFPNSVNGSLLATPMVQ